MGLTYEALMDLTYEALMGLTYEAVRMGLTYGPRPALARAAARVCV